MRAHSMHDMMSDVDDPLIQEISLTDRSNKKKLVIWAFALRLVKINKSTLSII